MKTVTFISHYCSKDKHIRLSDDNYNKLMDHEIYSPIELYLNDVERVSYGLTPIIFSKSQIMRLNKGVIGLEYWDKIV